MTRERRTLLTLELALVLSLQLCKERDTGYFPARLRIRSAHSFFIDGVLFLIGLAEKTPHALSDVPHGF